MPAISCNHIRQHLSSEMTRERAFTNPRDAEDGLVRHGRRGEQLASYGRRDGGTLVTRIGRSWQTTRGEVSTKKLRGRRKENRPSVSWEACAWSYMEAMVGDDAFLCVLSRRAIAGHTRGPTMSHLTTHVSVVVGTEQRLEPILHVHGEL